MMERRVRFSLIPGTSGCTREEKERPRKWNPPLQASIYSLRNGIGGQLSLHVFH